MVLVVVVWQLLVLRLPLLVLRLLLVLLPLLRLLVALSLIVPQPVDWRPQHWPAPESKRPEPQEPQQLVEPAQPE